MKHVLLYTSAEDVASKAPALFPAHKARIDEYAAGGDLLLIGAFGDPQREGSMAVFRTRESAEAFASGDPFVVNGVVASYEIRGWNEILMP